MLLQGINLTILQNIEVRFFSVMFPDSEIEKKITCCPTKASYLSVFGLAPYFQGNLVAQLDEVPFYSISFDESYLVPFYSILFDESYNKITKTSRWTSVSGFGTMRKISL